MDAIQFILEINFMLISYVTSALSYAVKKMKEKNLAWKMHKGSYGFDPLN